MNNRIIIFVFSYFLGISHFLLGVDIIKALIISISAIAVVVLLRHFGKTTKSIGYAFFGATSMLMAFVFLQNITPILDKAFFYL